MIAFRDIEDGDPCLGFSPMISAIRQIGSYIDAHGGIGLTPSKAFKRVFVHWAAKTFDWPGLSEEELFVVNKVLNEGDFPPLADIHEMLIALRIGRHHKGRFTLTKTGRALIDQPGRLFGVITPVYPFQFDHAWSLRTPSPLLGNWDIYLNVLNVEAEDGITGEGIRRCLFGEPNPEEHFDDVASALYVQVLRPLCWTGLLQETQTQRWRHSDSVFTKTPLWKAALALSTDDEVLPATRH